MTPSQSRALTRFERAVEARAFKGSQPPEDHAGIEREYEIAKAALISKLDQREVTK
jgi:hypothetical protein